MAGSDQKSLMTLIECWSGVWVCVQGVPVARQKNCRLGLSDLKKKRKHGKKKN